ncbi:MAG: hypothetical protein H6886_00640 [Hyphomicrobiaceae bacterium]|nr:hypothetical protein [Hyphomicrobiaceae bacterium]
MTIAERRAELDETIESLARLPSYQQHSREALAAISDTIDYIRALTGTLPPQCKGSLNRAFAKALAGDTRSAINSLLQTLITVDALTSKLGLKVPPADPPPPARDPTDPKPVREVADALLAKLRKQSQRH